MLLIVDDYENEYFTTIFRRAGIECFGVASGEDALHILKGIQADAILTDLGMPAPYDGLTFIEILGNKYKIGILSGLAIEGEHRNIFEELGVTGFFDKNTEPGELIRQIRKWMGV